MKCPVCDVPLSISSREGVEIDFCPQCRGVWLDRGELDKILDRVAATMAPIAAPPPPAPAAPERPREDDRYRSDDRRRDDDRSRDDERYRYDDRYRYDKKKSKSKKKKAQSFLEDIFDL